MNKTYWEENRFASRGELFGALAKRLTADIVAAPSTVNCALAGGETPQDVYRLLQKLHSADVDFWQKVNFYPTDERCVAEDSPRRNDAMLRRCLGGAAQIFSLAESGAPPPLDIALLGMGEDGHIASLFPGEQSGGESIFRVSPQGAAEERLSIPLPAFVAAKKVFILFCGEKKWNVFMQMREELPVTNLVTGRKTKTEIFYAE